MPAVYLSSMEQIKVGSEVAWKWRDGIAAGVVMTMAPERTIIMSKGVRVVRNGTPENPALTILHDSGTKVLKLASEVQIAR